MKLFASLPLGVAVSLLAAVLPAQAQTPVWKLAGSETVPAPEGLTHQVQTLTGSGTLLPVGVTLHFVTFDTSKETFAVYDQGDLGRNSLGEVMSKNHCLAGTNGGFFLPDFEPMGLLLAQGKLVKKPSRARLLSGALVVTGHRIALRRSQEPLPGKNAHQAVQSGPFLVEFGRALPGLNAVRSARRTAVFTDGKLRWGLVSTTSLTLEELGKVLTDPTLLPGGLRIDKALNLDGGSSTGLWVAPLPGQAPFYLHELGIVRDFVGIVPRSSEAAGAR